MNAIARFLLAVALASLPLLPGRPAQAADLTVASTAAPAAEPAAAGTPESGKVALAVMDFESVGASKEEASAVTDRMREVMLQVSKIPVVDRSKTQEMINLMADQQATCTGGAAKCQSAVGKLSGVNRLITGRVTKFGPDAWQVYATLLNVETGQTLKVDTVRMRGDLLALLDKGVPDLAAKLFK